MPMSGFPQSTSCMCRGRVITEVYKFLNDNFAQVVPLMWGFSYASSVGPETGADAAHPEGPKSR